MTVAFITLVHFFLRRRGYRRKLVDFFSAFVINTNELCLMKYSRVPDFTRSTRVKRGYESFNTMTRLRLSRVFTRCWQLTRKFSGFTLHFVLRARCTCIRIFQKRVRSREMYPRVARPPLRWRLLTGSARQSIRRPVNYYIRYYTISRVIICEVYGNLGVKLFAYSN